MSVLSDSIEQFIIELMEQCDGISLQRNELAQHFACAPSQINYVLSTRFTLERGYTIVSKRGSGGYIRVQRVDTDRDGLLHECVCVRIGDAIGLREAGGLIAKLYTERILSEREASMALAAAGALPLVTREIGNAARARLLRAMFEALMRYDENQDEALRRCGENQDQARHGECREGE